MSEHEHTKTDGLGDLALRSALRIVRDELHQDFTWRDFTVDQGGGVLAPGLGRAFRTPALAVAGAGDLGGVAEISAQVALFFVVDFAFAGAFAAVLPIL